MTTFKLTAKALELNGEVLSTYHSKYAIAQHLKALLFG